MNQRLQDIVDAIKSKLPEDYSYDELITECRNYTPTLTNGEVMLVLNIIRSERLVADSNQINGNYVTTNVPIVGIMNDNFLPEFIEALKTYEVNEFVLDVMLINAVQEIIRGGFIIIGYEDYMQHYYKEEEFKHFHGYRMLLEPEKHI